MTLPQTLSGNFVNPRNGTLGLLSLGAISIGAFLTLVLPLKLLLWFGLAPPSECPDR